MTPTVGAVLVLAFVVGYSLAVGRARRRSRCEDKARERILEEVLAKKPSTILEYTCIVEESRPPWIPLAGFLEAMLHSKGDGHGMPSVAWRAIDEAKPSATETGHLVRALLEAERARERGAAVGAACTGCPLHCGKGKGRT